MKSHFLTINFGFKTKRFDKVNNSDKSNKVLNKKTLSEGEPVTQTVPVTSAFIELDIEGTSSDETVKLSKGMKEIRFIHLHGLK